MCKNVTSYIGLAKRIGICALLTHKNNDNGAAQEKNKILQVITFKYFFQGYFVDFSWNLSVDSEIPIGKEKWIVFLVSKIKIGVPH